MNADAARSLACAWDARSRPGGSVSTHLETLRYQLRLNRFGLRFCEPEAEREYRAWHRQIAVPFIRIGIIASPVAWSPGILGRQPFSLVTSLKRRNQLCTALSPFS